MMPLARAKRKGNRERKKKITYKKSRVSSATRIKAHVNLIFAFVRPFERDKKKNIVYKRRHSYNPLLSLQ